MHRSNEIRKSFDNAAASYEQVAIVQNEIGKRLLERLEYIKINPTRILDLGSGAGQFSRALKKRYPKAQIVSLDLSFGMLKQSKTQQALWRKWPLVCGDMEALPFADKSFDLVFSNQVIHWAEDMPALAKELLRIMQLDGCLLMSTLGPDTFQELRSSYSAIDDFAHANDFMDMHDLGDILQHTPFVDPVIDMEKITVRYSSVRALLQALKAQGVRNIHAKRNAGLSGTSHRQAFEQHYLQHYQQEGKVPLSYEVVYAHAWRGAQRIDGDMRETTIPVEKIGRVRR